MPTISLDLTFLYEILNAPDPLVAAWLLLKAGGWIPVVVVFAKGLSWIWLNERGGIFLSQQKQVFLAIDVPKMNEQLPKAVENIFAHLQGAYSTPTKKEYWFDGKQGPIFSFEIISIGGYIQFIVMSWEKYRDVIEAVIYAQYPEAEITEIEDYTKYVPQKWPDEKYAMFGTEFMLKRSHFYPIKTYPEFEDKIAGEFKDPMASLLEAISKLQPEEQVWFQILIQLGPQDWAKAGEKLVKKLIGAKPEKAKPSIVEQGIEIPLAALRYTADALLGGGEAEKQKDDPRSQMLFLSPGERTTVEAVERKIAKIGHKTKIRFLYIGPKQGFRTSTVIAFVRGALHQFTFLDMNSFVFNGLVTTKRDYFWQQHSFWYYLSGTFYRTVNERMRLNFRGYKYRSLWTGGKTFYFGIEELATIWHFPVMTVKAPLVKKTEAKRTEPPVGLPVSALRPIQLKPPTAEEPTAPPSGAAPAESGPVAPEDLPFA